MTFLKTGGGGVSTPGVGRPAPRPAPTHPVDPDTARENARGGTTSSADPDPETVRENHRSGSASSAKTETDRENRRAAGDGPSEQAKVQLVRDKLADGKLTAAERAQLKSSGLDLGDIDRLATALKDKLTRAIWDAGKDGTITAAERAVLDKQFGPSMTWELVNSAEYLSARQFRAAIGAAKPPTALELLHMYDANGGPSDKAVRKALDFWAQRIGGRAQNDLNAFSAYLVVNGGHVPATQAEFDRMLPAAKKALAKRTRDEQIMTASLLLGPGGVGVDFVGAGLLTAAGLTSIKSAAVFAKNAKTIGAVSIDTYRAGKQAGIALRSLSKSTHETVALLKKHGVDVPLDLQWAGTVAKGPNAGKVIIVTRKGASRYLDLSQIDMSGDR